MSDLPVLEDRLRTLMLASLAGDAGCYRTMLSELTRHLRRYFQRRLHPDLTHQVDDLVQETLVAIHTRRMTYDPSRAFTAWVYAIARYKLIDMLRRSRHEQHVPIDDVADFIADDTASTQAAARNDLDAMLGTLPEQTGRLIRSVKIEGQTVADVAGDSGLSESAVKVAVHRGMKTLLARFGGKS